MSVTERLVYLPLGGAGEIGMNMYLYGWGAPGKERWIMVDCGVTFPDMEGSPGVDLIMADTAFIEERRDRLEAILITHAHEDHVGAIGLLRARLGPVPVYARPFTARVARNKFEQAGVEPSHLKVIGTLPEMVKAGPFSLGFMPVPHSIPEASAVVIDCPAGRVLHTGDLKLDPTPLLGDAFDPEAFKAVSKDGLLALVCDSTNVFAPHPGRSEAEIEADTIALFTEAKGMVVATTFASNLARLRTLANAAKASGRAVAVAGRAMHRMIGFAREVGLLQDFPDTVDINDISDIPREHVFLLATGSQGEHRGASASMARDSYFGINLTEGDMFLFSSKTIPGNEKSVARIINQLVARGVRVIEDDSRYHVSGHANRPDIAEVHRLTQPDLVVPMHGEYRHLAEHKALAGSNGFKAALAPNGRMIDLSDNPGAEVEDIATGRLYQDGSVLIGARDGVVRERLRMAMRGLVSVSVVIDENNRPLEGVWAEPQGLADPRRGELSVAIEEALETALERAAPKDIKSDSNLEDLIARICRKTCQDLIGKKPLVKVLINRLSD